MKNVNNKEKMQEFFDKRADSYDKHMQDNVTNFTDFYKKIAEPIKKTKTKIKVLDLGCGTGLELEYIFQKAPNARVTGIDLSEKMLEELKAKYRDKIKQITLIRESYLEKEKRLLREFEERAKIDDRVKDGFYHIDIPFSLKTQKKLLAEVGFNELNVIYSEDESVIYENKK